MRHSHERYGEFAVIALAGSDKKGTIASTIVLQDDPGFSACQAAMKPPGGAKEETMRKR